MPREPEAQALLALMLYGARRRPARTDTAPRPLEVQDPNLWDARMLADADLAMGQAAAHASLGRYQIEAAIQAAHADRRHGRATDWPAIAGFYRGLVTTTTAPVSRHRRRPGRMRGARCGPRSAGPGGRRAGCPISPGRRCAHLLAALGDTGAAASAYDRAIALSADPALRDFLAGRKARLPAH